VHSDISFSCSRIEQRIFPLLFLLPAKRRIASIFNIFRNNSAFHKYLSILQPHGSKSILTRRKKGEILIMNDVLIDMNQYGGERPWKDYKKQAALLVDSLERLDILHGGLDYYKKAHYIRDCASRLDFHGCPHGHEKRLSRAWFCRVRLCPMCQWRRSLHQSFQMRQVAREAMHRHSNMDWFSLTLTTENAHAENLLSAFKHINAAWAKLTDRKAFKQHIHGFYKAIEITTSINLRSYSPVTYHVHPHIILAVTPSYSTHGGFTKKRWTTLWQDALGVDYIPSIAIKKVKPKKQQEHEGDIPSHKDRMLHALAYEAYYSSKSDAAQYLIKENEDLTDLIVSTLHENLHGTRRYSFGGLLKNIHHELFPRNKSRDIDDDKADLVHIGERKHDSCSCCNSPFTEQVYNWNNINFFKTVA
jgi:plasmid rolling circle replication initiator protein Rep